MACSRRRLQNNGGSNVTSDESGHEAGFTLIELMMVVLIIAILITIAIPSLTAARGSANESAARSVLGNSHRALKVILADDVELSSVVPADLETAEPALAYHDSVTNAEAEHNEVSVAVGADYVILSTHANGDGCIAIRERLVGTDYQRIAGPACPAGAFDPNAGWVEGWPPRS